jgi:hypothetical protein
MPPLTSDQILTRANTLANQIAAAHVPDAQLSMVLVHLKRHRDVAATLRLLAALRLSPFGRRNRGTPAQFRALEENVRRALQGPPTWEEAAAILGWGRRLVGYYTRR